MIFLMVKKKIENQSLDFMKKSMFLNLTYCFILIFCQWHFVNLGVEMHL